MAGLGLRGAALITGAGGALGRAITLQFARDGVRRIAALDLSDKGLTETAEALKSEVPNVEFLPISVDIGDEEQVIRAFGSTVSKFGRIDYAINNAAIAAPFLPTGETTIADFERVQRVNLRGTWLCEREALKQMVNQEPLEALFIDTPLVTPVIRTLLGPQIDRTPMGRLANPEEIADAVVYLASDRASYITGSVLSVSLTLRSPRADADPQFR
ncbi:hypothetical protein LTR84_006805 [Exophiala bonariae]|uniref:SDR family oxidoreductase n=1 Tax=Exophiala bonariae TaxID=1690606 RepID=A0AAV9N000_9EURO|nr:hypothetical protein LTR84_006805 [Exophiala bonariae]